MGVHLLVELFGVKSELISKKKDVKKVLDRAISKSKLKAISCLYHQFKPFGVSCVYLLKSSHVSFHSWPEKSYVALDVFSCDKNEKKVFEFFKVVKDGFKPKRIIKKVIKRDYYEREIN